MNWDVVQGKPIFQWDFQFFVHCVGIKYCRAGNGDFSNSLSMYPERMVVD